MEIKNIKLSLLILSILVTMSFGFFSVAQEQSNTDNNIFLDSDQDGLTDEEERSYGTDPKDSDTDGDSYSDGTEVKSGYNPLKPAPGDKLIESFDQSSAAKLSGELATEDNLTNQVAQKVYELTTKSDPEEQELSLEDINSLVSDSLSSAISEEALPEIDPEEIKIKEQNYSNLSDEKAQEKRKEDFTNYIISLYYILSSNSPEPLTSMSDISSISGDMANQVMLAVTTRDADAISDLATSGERMLGEMKEIEVPQDMVEMHTKGLQFAKYALSLQDDLETKEGDPLGDLANFSKVKGFMQVLSSFSQDAEAKFVEYDLNYDEEMKERLRDYGLFAPVGDTTTDSEN